ncbi:MAG: pseudouridine-5'-phosphate glycosidase [Chloroflexota bacterium]
MNPRLTIHPEVEEALQVGKPVVALESTLITHGLPVPDNIKVAQAMEAAVRENGAIPATIAILNGQITVGLTADQLEYLSSAKNARKCSRRDFPIVVARKEDGGTTVAGTMLVAHWAGIRVFATGGIGGVHRGHPFDISADLVELGRTPITVVCAGAKAFLDIPLTLETLETQGVPVVGYQTDSLPTFYSRSSELPVDVRLDSAQEIAELITARDQLNMRMGILITNPVPVEDEWPQAEAQKVIEKALGEADAAQISGKEATPYMLDRINELSHEQSKRANIALLINNSRLGGEVAKALSQQSS